MELRQLEYLIAVVDEYSFSKAARRLGVAQPSVSEQISKLESELRQPLLDRLPRRVVPTQAGLQLVAHARQILAQVFEATCRAGECAEGKLTGKFTIGAIPTIAPFLLPRIIPSFEQCCPDIELSVVEETTQKLVELMGEGVIDLGIASTTPVTPHLDIETIVDEELVLLLPSNHRLARLRRIELKDIQSERFVALHEMHCLADQCARFCMHRQLRPPIVVRGNSLFTLASFVAMGMGISLVPKMMAESSACAIRGCVFRAFEEEAPSRPLTFLWPLLRYRTLASREFARVTRELINASSGVASLADHVHGHQK